MDLDNDYIDGAAFAEGLTEILMQLLLPQLKEMLEFCIDTNCVNGLNMLLAVLREFKFEE